MTKKNESVKEESTVETQAECVAPECEAGECAAPEVAEVEVRDEWETRYNELNNSHLRLMLPSLTTTASARCARRLT